MNKLVSARLSTTAKRVPGQPEHRKNPAKPSLLGFAGFFLCSAVRFAHRVNSEAVLTRGLPARPPLKTGPRAGFPGAAGPGTVAGVKPVGGKPATFTATNAASFGSFLGGRKERPRKFPSAEPPQHLRRFFLLRQPCALAAALHPAAREIIGNKQPRGKHPADGIAG